MTPDPVTIKQVQAQVALAQENLAEAQQNLTNLLNNNQTTDVALDQTLVASAQTALDDATIQAINSNTITAPFMGIVEALDVSVGDTVSDNTTILTIADPKTVDISASIDEIDAVNVAQGQTVDISLDALPNIQFIGKVSTISPLGTNQSGVVSYPVTITMTMPTTTGAPTTGIPPTTGITSGTTTTGTRPTGIPTTGVPRTRTTTTNASTSIQIFEGMSATVNIIYQQATHVLVVPTNAVQGTTQSPTVNVLVNGQIQKKSVQLGITDGENYQVISGLQAGDVLVLRTKTTGLVTTTSTSTGIPGGGFGGFGGGGGIRIGGGIP